MEVETSLRTTDAALPISLKVIDKEYEIESAHVKIADANMAINFHYPLDVHVDCDPKTLLSVNPEPFGGVKKIATFTEAAKMDTDPVYDLIDAPKDYVKKNVQKPR